jgi:integral membrane protein
MKNFRILSWSEGISFLILVLVAMPLKYAADMPEVVKIVGMIHGVLFVAYMGGVIWMKETLKWDMKTTLKAALGAFIPFGMIYVDKYVLKLR